MKYNGNIKISKSEKYGWYYSKLKDDKKCCMIIFQEEYRSIKHNRFYRYEVSMCIEDTEKECIDYFLGKDYILNRFKNKGYINNISGTGNPKYLIFAYGVLRLFENYILIKKEKQKDGIVITIHGADERRRKTCEFLIKNGYQHNSINTNIFYPLEEVDDFLWKTIKRYGGKNIKL